MAIIWNSIGNEIYDLVDVSRHLQNRQKNAIGFCNAMQMEICELMVALGFKWWSTKSENWVNVKESAERKHILEEYVDIGHFYISLGHALGFTPEEIQAAYEEKNKENFARQDRGY
jgi:dimeric dUTPase (all-alpha-NTP-PPase superfamily)